MVDMYSPPPTAQKTCDDLGTLTARAGVAGRNKESTNPEIPSSLCLPLDSRDERNTSSRMEHHDKSLIEGSSPQNGAQRGAISVSGFASERTESVECDIVGGNSILATRPPSMQMTRVRLPHRALKICCETLSKFLIRRCLLDFDLTFTWTSAIWTRIHSDCHGAKVQPNRRV